MSTPAKKIPQLDTHTPLSNAILEQLHSTMEPVGGHKRRVYCVLYGNPGSGKTVLASSLGNCNLLYTTESGDISLLNHPELEKKTRKIHYDPIKGWDALLLILQALNNQQLLHNGEPVDTLILDNLSGMAERYIVRSLREKSFNRADKDLPGQQDYGVVFQLMRPLLLELERCKANVIVICHARFPDQDARAKGELTRPDLPSSIYKIVNEGADVVGFIHQDAKSGRTIQLQGDNKLVAKNRLNNKVSTVPVDQFTTMVRSYISGE